MNSIFFLRSFSSRLITQFVYIFLPYKRKYHGFKFYRAFSTLDYPRILTLWAVLAVPDCQRLYRGRKNCLPEESVAQVSYFLQKMTYYLEDWLEVSRYLCMVLFLQAHFTCGQGSSEVFLMLGIRHRYVDFYLSLVPRPSRIYLDDSLSLQLLNILKQFFDRSFAQVDFLLLILKMTLKLGYFLNLPVHFPEICP